jgi:hypothetical protein
MKDNIKLEIASEEIAFENMSWSKKRIFLLKRANNSCVMCGFSKTRDDGRGILEIDHIDADHTNNSIENLRVLCPNCHALTPNFRNWGRGAKKSSKRFRKGNAGFSEARDSALIEKHKKRTEQNSLIVSIVLDTFENGVIDYRNWGWISKLNALLTKDYNMMFKQQTVGRKVKELMPAFYEQHCYKRL